MIIYVELSAKVNDPNLGLSLRRLPRSSDILSYLKDK